MQKKDLEILYKKRSNSADDNYNITMEAIEYNQRTKRTRLVGAVAQEDYTSAYRPYEPCTTLMHIAIADKSGGVMERLLEVEGAEDATSLTDTEGRLAVHYAAGEQ